MLPSTTALHGRAPRSPLAPAVFARPAELVKKRRDPAAGLLKRGDSDPDESLGIFLRQLLRARVRRMLSCAGKAAASSDAEVLHRLRVSARRLQAYLRIFQACFPGKKFRAYTRALRKLLRASGRVREYDLLIWMLDQYKASCPISERLIFELLIARKSRERREARKELEHILATLNRKKFGLDLLEFVGAPR